MIDSNFRPYYQKFAVDPLLPLLNRLRCSPAICTAVALCSGVLTGAALLFSMPIMALCFLILSGYLDTVDGSLARYQGNPSYLGAMQDIISDRIVESSVIMGLFAIDPVGRGGLCLLMLASVLLCVTTFLVAGIFIQQDSEKSFYYSPGLMERAEAFIFFSQMILFPSAFTPLSLLFTLLVSWTAIKRYRDISQSEHRG